MLKQRVLTALLAAPFLIAAILTPYTIVFKILVIVCVLIALWEFFTLVGLPKNEKTFAMILGAFHLNFILFNSAFLEKNLLEVSFLLLAIFAYYCINPGDISKSISRIAWTFAGIFYVGTFGGLIGLIRAGDNGLFWICFLMGTVWVNDTSAYFVGRAFGKHKLAPQISPGKSIEGFFGGAMGSCLGFLIFWFVFKKPISLSHGFTLALIIAVVGPVGDLSESLLKRSVGAKDSGTIMPGHGGILDRIDALLFAAPIVYFLGRH